MSQDFTALDWVKGEIEDTLKQAQLSLDDYVENPEDESLLNFCLNYLHQVHGTLTILELYGATLLTTEMEALTKALIADRCEDQNSALEVLMRAILQLPQYLDHVKQGRRDLPIILLPILNELRAAQGSQPLSQSSVFTPNINFNPELNAAQLSKINTQELINWVKKVRQMLQAASLQLIQQQQPQVAKQYLSKIFARLHKNLGHSPQGTVWLAALAFSEWLEKQADTPKETARLLRSIDGELKHIIDQGSTALNRPVSLELIRQLLFFIHNTELSSTAINQAKRHYKLAEASPSEQELAAQQAQFEGPDRATIHHVLNVLIEEIAQIKDRLDLVIRRPDNRSEAMAELAQHLKQITSTMSMLGLGMPLRVMQQQLDSIHTMLAAQQITDAQLNDIAGALLYVEASLNGMSKEGSLHASADDSALSQAQKSVLYEARNTLEEVKAAIVAYIAQQWSVDEILDVPDWLHSIEGSLRMLPLPAVADVLQQAADFVHHALIIDEVRPAWSVMDHFADLLTSIDYYLERHANHPLQNDNEFLLRAQNLIEEIYTPSADSHEHYIAASASLTESLTARYDDEIGIEEAEEILRRQQEMAQFTPALEIEETELDASQLEPVVETTEEALIDDEIIEIFLEEADEVMAEIHQYWPSFKTDPTDQTAITTVRRAFHTLKGSGRMVSANTIAELAWAIENMLNRLLDNSIQVSEHVYNVVDDAIAALPNLIQDFSQQRPASLDTQAIIQPANDLTAGQVPAPIAPTETEEIELDPALLGIFISEAHSHLESIQTFITESTHQNYQNPLSESLQRALHTLKGSAYMAQVTCIAILASALDKLVKEIRAYQLGNSVALIELLQQCLEHFQQILADRETLLAPCDKYTHMLQQHIDGIYQASLEVAHSRGVIGQGPSAADIASFMAQGMDSLLDAEELLNLWHNSDDKQILQRLREDLEQVSHSAQQAQLHHIQTFAEALNEFYQRVENSASLASNEIVGLAQRSHEALLDMLDALAADQEVARPEALLEELRQWQAETAAEPASELIPKQPTQYHNVDVIDLLPNIEDFAQQEPHGYAYPAASAINSTNEIAATSAAESSHHELLQLFLEEADESLENLKQLFKLWQHNHSQPSHAAQLERELHTLEGGAAMAGFTSISDFCQTLSALYHRLSSGRIGHSEELATLLSQAHQTLSEQIEQLRQGNTPAAASHIQTQLQTYLSQPLKPEPDTEANLTEEVDGDILDPEILDIFMEEATELEEDLDTQLNRWRADPENTQCSDDIQRILHTLKGGARLAQANQLGDIVHQLEARILHAQQGRQNVDDAFFNEIFTTQDQIHNLLEQLRLPQTPASSTDNNADSEFVAVESHLPADIVPHNMPEPSAEMSTERSSQELIRVPAELLENLVNLAGETAIGRGRVGQQVTDFSHTLEEMEMTLERLRDQLRRLDLETEAQVLFRQERQGPSHEDFDPLEMDRYSTIQQLSRALVESASDLTDLKNTLNNKARDTETLLLQQSRINTELQEGLMQTRMVPFQRIVPRLRRIVRQVSLELDKQVELSVSNADGEMDRSILERLISPLEHMVRNAVDHGIEPPAARLQADKPEQGHIQLHVNREGGDIVITMSDDGRGINLDAIRKKAIEKGFIDADTQLSEYETLQFITQAGFSTAATITQISGRGVGMDVVANEIKQMGGSFEINSISGQGCRFIIRLPFTVSVNRALMIRLGEENYAIPLNNIQGIVRASVQDLRKLYQKAPDQRYYHYAGTDYQIDYLGSLLSHQPAPDLSEQQSSLALLLVRGAIPFAVQVDALFGSREIVVKALGPHFGSVTGVSGGTILGDGSVVIILDLPALVRAYNSEANLLNRQHTLAAPRLSRQAKVLVVDDSVTVRKVTSRLLERNGMLASTAKDGIDALEILQDNIPDLILLDIEMPRLDGFEVAKQVRHDSRLKHIPIIMITSRTGDKHRQRALAIGVNKYLGKPFQEENLLSHINQLLAEQQVG